MSRQGSGGWESVLDAESLVAPGAEWRSELYRVAQAQFHRTGLGLVHQSWHHGLEDGEPANLLDHGTGLPDVEVGVSVELHLRRRQEGVVLAPCVLGEVVGQLGAQLALGELLRLGGDPAGKFALEFAGVGVAGVLGDLDRNYRARGKGQLDPHGFLPLGRPIRAVGAVCPIPIDGTAAGQG